ncbi:MAG: hypothetical protein HFE63_02345 [Clostridiales bacterium]|nr:hypothetical protein [Clostridiales bacterium]
MNIIKYPDTEAVNTAIKNGDPLLMLVSFDSSEIIISGIDDTVEHWVLLSQTGHDPSDIDKYFRVVVNRDGADWTFVCPPAYKNIVDRQRRLKAFYKDGFDAISDALLEIGFMVGINIPTRYRRHWDELWSN